MALSISQTVALGRILKPGMRVASFGYPDMIAPLDIIKGILGAAAADLGYRKDALAICQRHGLALRGIPDAESFFSLMGAELTVFDIVRERGCEIIADLNRDWGREVAEMYDIALDVGTAEHCFNIGTAMQNMAGLLQKGGIIIHENPFNCGNHGFVNLNPTFYADFYAANGFELMECRLVTKDGRGAIVPHTKRFQFTSEECNVFAMARRVKVQPFVWPQQSKYAKSIASPAAGDKLGVEEAA